MCWLQFDSKVSIDGVATSLGVMGAAVGYLINLVREWRKERRDRALLGTSFVILDFLERADGSLSEKALLDRYVDSGSEDVRTKYGATKPEELSPVDFERRLRTLQLEGFIAPAGSDRWRTCFKPIDEYELRNLMRERIGAAITDPEYRKRLVQRITDVMHHPQARYQWKSLVEALMVLDPARAVAELEKAAQSDDVEQAALAIAVLSSLQRR